MRDIRFPELEKNRRITGTKVFIFDSPCRYDVILGNDLLDQAGSIDRPEGPNRNSAASLDRGRRCLTPIYGEIQINSDQKFYRAQRRNYYVWDLVRKSL